MEKLIDLSYPIEDNMPIYPGDIKTNLFQTHYLNENGYNNYRLDISMHTGTHIDSPMHMIKNGKYISEFPLESFVGTGCILDVRNEHIINMKEEYENRVLENSVLLLYTGWGDFYNSKKYYENHPVISLDFCNFLLKKRIKMLGVDMPSADDHPFAVHKLLFQNGIFILENLANLEKLLGAKEIEILAFPLKIKADSSMVRAVARIRSH